MASRFVFSCHSLTELKMKMKMLFHLLSFWLEFLILLGGSLLVLVKWTINIIQSHTLNPIEELAIKEFNHIHDKEMLQLSSLTFEYSVWLDLNGGINWVSLGDFGEIFAALELFSSMKQLLCIIHALGEWEVYKRKCFFEFFWCWDLYPSGRFVLQVSRCKTLVLN